MLSRRRSRVFLLDTVDRGSEFVETLKFVYPKADDLQEKDFDWLFDCPETEQFLESFCNIVGEENVSSSTELEAYEKLVISGKPVLEGEALEQVLKTCRQASQLRCAMQENDTLPLETLEQEVQMLKSQCACRVMRRTKLQIRLASLKRELSHSAEKKEKASRELKKAHLRLEPENFQSNDALSQACKKVKELMQWHRKPASKRQEASMAAADLEHCLELEEKVSKALLGFSPKVLPDVVSDVEADQTVLVKRGQGDSWEKLDTGSMERRAQKVLLDSKSTICNDDSEGHKTTYDMLKSQVLPKGQLGNKNEPEFTCKALLQETDRMESENFRTVQDGCQGGLKMRGEAAEMEHAKDDKLSSYQEELERMALAYMCSQGKALVTSANIKGISYTLKWAGKALKAAKENKVEEKKGELYLRRATFQEQLCILQREVRQAKTKKLVPLLQTSASLLRLPVVCGELTLETRRLGHLVSMQEQAAGQMMVQWSHLELLGLLLMHEQKNLQQMKTQLEGMVTTSNESHAKLQEWQACFDDSRFSIKQCPRTLIDPSDLTMLRLWEMLNRHSQDKQLFHAYGALAGWGSRLCQELRMLKVQLATPHSQLPKLESDNEVLHCLMYGDCNQLMLRAQGLEEPLEQLYTTQAKLYQMLMDTLSDVKAKQKSLRSHFQQTERSLYMHFFTNPEQLKELVQEAEKQTLAFS
ncbi:HAUS augmin-like complex subunit 3 [Podarcis raffonei]|uniref:HAUS augmin-like complex subunit 3 n=1 Tax=Podarcis raffonei TaxID=65483 RepID=UPI0023290C1B|nr:HAUS augmin-like complex subunit 3 [Podarcis raffonei]XP_053233496.1 HAUS augmin-like complex subunit 3 [Podarcis raffonei]